jgi:hypothetical protein
MPGFGVKRLHSTMSDPGQEDSDTDIDDNEEKRANSQQLDANVNEEMHNPRFRPWTKEDRVSFITRFEAAYSRPIEAVIDAGAVADSDVFGIETTINTTNTETSENIIKTFMYFIGRLNPPHD